MLGPMPSLALAAQKISLFEGFKPKPYLDSASIPTIAWGTTHYPDRRPVSLSDDEATPTQGLAYLENDLSHAAAQLWQALNHEPSGNEWAAMLSLAYNIGSFAMARSSVVRFFNLGALDRAADAFLLWDKIHVNGQLVEIAGLLNRRRAERTLFLTPDTTI